MNGSKSKIRHFEWNEGSIINKAINSTVHENGRTKEQKKMGGFITDTNHGAEAWMMMVQ